MVVGSSPALPTINFKYMKKIIYILTAILTLTGCCSQTEIPNSIVESTQSRLTIKGYGSYNIHEFNYKGHSYIMIKGSEQMAVTHNPDCSCKHRY